MNALWRPAASPAPLPDDTNAPRPRSFRLQPGLGQGWTQTHGLGGGLELGRMQCLLAQGAHQHFDCDSDSLRLMLVLQGGQRVIDGRGRAIEARAGDVIVRNGYPGALRTEVAARVPVASIALDVPRGWAAALQADGLTLAHLGPPGRCALLRPTGSAAARCMAAGQRLLALGHAPGPLALLELQSLAFGLLHGLLTAHAPLLPAATHQARNASRDARWQRAIDEALHILHAEWDQPLTIACLARRAGINECYLKELFRQRTGQTIAAYLRALRMGHARRLLESGQATLQQAAHACGYSRADKFSLAFRRAHGVMPSQIKA